MRAMILTRQKLPTLAGTPEKAREGVARGAYVLAEADGGAPRAVILASGSEVHLAAAAHAALAAEGVPVRVVSMPSMELFEAADASYRASVGRTVPHSSIGIASAPG